MSEKNRITKTSSKQYTDIYEVTYPVKFFFIGDEYDGIEIGPLNEKDTNAINMAMELNKKLAAYRAKKNKRN